MHGIGNDFIITDSSELGKIDDMPFFVRNVCDRRRGIGADGLIVHSSCEEAPVKMVLWNSDGSTGEMCGNGIRCLARYAVRSGIVPGPGFNIMTDAGIREVFVDPDSNNVGVDMGKPSFRSLEIPVKFGMDEFVEQDIECLGRVWKCTCVNVGNPHCVIFVKGYDDIDVAACGRAMEKHNVFPAGVNVEFVLVHNPHSMEVRVWERGAGITEACGTGACASFAAACRTGRAALYAEVELPGGVLKISYGKTGNLQMKGPADFVFSGEYM